MSRTRDAWNKYEEAKRNAWKGDPTDLGLWDEALYQKQKLIEALQAPVQDKPEDETMQETIDYLIRTGA